MEDRYAAEPNPEPEDEPSDPHQPPLDDDADADYLEEDDPRRIEALRRRRRPEV
jgi:hypothetical protein